MERAYVIASAQYRAAGAPLPPTPIDDLGFSTLRLMRLSEGKATGVRANLQIGDPTALDDLARHYKASTRLEWTFETGGGGGSLSVVLRWTKFDHETGKLQVVRTAVRRDLITDVEEQTSAAPSRDRRDRESDPAAARPRASQQQVTERKTARSSPPDSPSEAQSDSVTIQQQISALLAHLLQRDDFLTDQVDPE